MAIAQTTFSSLTNIWSDHRLSRTLKLRTCGLAVCSTLTHASEAWALTDPLMRCINGFNSRCLHVITGEDYRVTATTPAYNLLLAIRHRCLLPRARTAHAREQDRAACADGTVRGRHALPGGESLHGLSRHGPGPAGGPYIAPTSKPTDSTIKPHGFTMPYIHHISGCSGANQQRPTALNNCWGRGYISAD